MQFIYEIFESSIIRSLTNLRNKVVNDSDAVVVAYEGRHRRRGPLHGVDGICLGTILDEKLAELFLP